MQEQVIKEVKRKSVQELENVLDVDEDKKTGITLATPEESRVLVEDLGRCYNAPPGLILAFKDRKTGALSPYFTAKFYGLMLERKKYMHLSKPIPGPKHDPKNHIYHYIYRLVPSLSDSALEALKILKDTVDRDTFYKEWLRLTEPIEEEGYASMDTVKAWTFKNDYNLDRMARTRGYRHLAALYTGIGSPMEKEDEEEADEIAETIDITPEKCDKVFGNDKEA